MLKVEVKLLYKAQNYVRHHQHWFSRSSSLNLRDITDGIGERYSINMEALGCDKNQVHLLCGGHPKLAPGRIVQIYKSITARELFRREP